MMPALWWAGQKAEKLIRSTNQATASGSGDFMDRPQTGLRRNRPAFRFHTKFPPTDTLAYAFLVQPRAEARPRALLSCPHSVSLRHILRQPDYGTLVANWKLVVHGLFRRRRVVRKEFLIGMIVVALAFMATACSSTPDANTNT